MSTPAIQKAIHEIVLLAAGRAATTEEMTLIESLEGTGNWAPLINLINSFIGSLAEANGSANIVKMLASNGTGVTLTTAEAEVVSSAIDAGTSTWADYFIENIYSEEAPGLVLTSRG